jgi:hypothetical protein
MKAPALALALFLALPLLSGCVGQGNGARDSDGDGLPDDQETAPHLISVVYANGTVEPRAATSDPHHADTDGDGLSDTNEYGFKTDPRDVDTDHDGLLDGHNVTLAPDSDAAKAWRARGVVELPPGSGKFVGEMDATPACSLSAVRGSTDGDKLSDGEEVLGWNATLRGVPLHVTSDPCVPDTDRDGLSDDAEKTLGTDPRSADTDRDGVPDGNDADPLWDLGLRVENVTVSGNGTTVRLDLNDGFAVGQASPGHAADLGVNDSTPQRGSLGAILILSARDGADGRTLDFFDDPRGAYLRLDLVAGTTARGEGPPATTRHVSFTGPDGALGFDWVVTRT